MSDSLTISSNSKRIAKNTLMLYVRMGVATIITLFSSRFVLQELGVSDFGIYNVVGGIVVLFTFLNSALTSATQRFLTFELGRKNFERLTKVFCTSVFIHISMIAFVLILAETVGYWFLNTHLNIPQERMSAANWVYQFSVMGMVLGILRVPYNALVIAYERMSFLAGIGIVECLARLGIVFLLGLGGFDKLESYSTLMLLVIFFGLVVNVIFCRCSFPQSVRLSIPRDKSLFKEMLSFSGWNIIAGVALLSASQGVSMIVNILCGVVVNAAMGIAHQVNAAVNQFVSNFQTAFQPQIVKAYAENDRTYFMGLIFGASKISYALLLILGLPIFINAEFFLGLWLGNVPEHTVSFVRLMLIFAMIDAVNGPLWMSIGATGDVRSYAVCVSALNLLNLPLIYLFLKMGFPPETALVVRIVINLMMMASRLIILRRKIKLPVRAFLKRICIPDFIVAVVVVPLPLCIKFSIQGEWFSAIASSAMSLIVCVPAIWFIGLDGDERKQLVFMLKAFRKKFGK